MNKKVKTVISKGALGAAIVAGPAAAFVGLFNILSSGLWMNIYMVIFWIFVFLHFFFRDESFNKLQVINTIIWMLSPWLVILILFTFKIGAYEPMFMSLGFLIVIYLINLLAGILKSEKEK
ncbi:hypothetical protein [Fodinibius sp. Rm-B-1B1-1]|uniref:hypothetical protein n=1 Tax=Fodinibius alkaliphilus TaxID=3140241 RepID=UPI00315A0DBF